MDRYRLGIIKQKSDSLWQFEATSWRLWNLQCIEKQRTLEGVQGRRSVRAHGEDSPGSVL